MKRPIFLLTAASLFVLFPGYICPNAGDLDPTFGNGTGKVTTMFPVGPDDQSRDVKIQPDGKIVVVGFSGPVFAVARYNVDGSLDDTFGTSGLVTTNFPGTTNFATKVNIQSDTKIVVSGSATPGIASFALVRYLNDGSLDPSFGVGGLVTTTFASAAASRGQGLQPDGKIVLGGDSGGDFAIARYNLDGSLDTSLNPTGVLPGTATTSLGVGSTSTGFSLILQEDGKILLAGRSDAQGPQSFALARYNVNGSLDTSFNPNGSIPGTVVTVFPGSSSSEVRQLELQPDGKILAGGRVTVGGVPTFIIARYTIDGSLDTSFGSDGSVITSVGPDMISASNALVLQPNGKIISGGRARFSGDDSFALVRYLNDGSLDTTFGTNGIVTTIFPGLADSIEGLTLQTDGRIVAAGYAGNAPNRFFAVARYLNDTLTITKKASSENPCPGQNITYTITVTNTGAGGGTVNEIYVEDVLPEGLEFRGFKLGGDEASSFDGETMVWNIPYLRIGKTAILKIKARVGKFACNIQFCNTAITTYSSVDEVTDSSLFESLGISTTEVFSTTECISSMACIYEPDIDIVKRIDCDLDSLQQAVCEIQQQQLIEVPSIAQINTQKQFLEQVIQKLNCLGIFLSAIDCTL